MTTAHLATENLPALRLAAALGCCLVATITLAVLLCEARREVRRLRRCWDCAIRQHEGNEEMEDLVGGLSFGSAWPLFERNGK